MSEKYPTRRDIMAEQIEQSQNHQAMQTLQNLGICKKVKDLELYHGRAGNESKWKVDPSFNNSDNNTGNYNVNKVAALSTSDDYTVAKEFAEARSYYGGTPEINKIISNDPDAMVVCSNINNLSEQDRKRANEAISQLCPSIMAGAPINFANRNDIRQTKPRDFINNKHGLMLNEDIPKIAQKTGLDQSLIVHIGSAINTQLLLKNGFLNKLCNAFLDNKHSINVSLNSNESQKETQPIPINHEFLANFFRSSHIIGALLPVNSVTIGKTIDNYLLFDLAKINTPERIAYQENKRNQFFGKIALKMNENSINSESNLLQSLNTNLYIQPQEIIEISKHTPGFEDIFEEDCGNWEGFKLGEHTETTLRLFDDNYADIMPASTLPIIRLALLVHDIGKPEAVKRHDKLNQRKYNVEYANKFMELNNINDTTRHLVTSMIGEGMEITSELIMDPSNIATKWKLYIFCEKIAKEYLNTNQVDKNTIRGFKNILAILQTCDSAAYTTMAVTRASDNIRYRNHGSFNSSFDSFKGFTGKRARLKQL